MPNMDDTVILSLSDIFPRDVVSTEEPEDLLIKQKMGDPGFLVYRGNVDQALFNEINVAIYQGFQLMIPAVRERFFQSEFQVVVGDERYFRSLYHEHGQVWLSPWGQCIRRENAHAFKGCPTLIIRSDVNPENFPDTFTNVIIDFMLHEIGHSMDHIEAKYNRYKSVRSVPFRLAVEQYWEEGLSRTATQIVYPLERRFRHDHMPNYNPDGDSCYKEMAAELFVKFHFYRREHGVDFADDRLNHNYGAVWERYKKDICPAIGAYVEANSARHIIAKEGAEKNSQGHSTRDHQYGPLERAYRFVEGLWRTSQDDGDSETQIWMPENASNNHRNHEDTGIFLPPHIK